MKYHTAISMPGEITSFQVVGNHSSNTVIFVSEVFFHFIIAFIQCDPTCNRLSLDIVYKLKVMSDLLYSSVLSHSSDIIITCS